MLTEEDKTKQWPNKLYLLHENENWLSELAEKGLKLKSFDKSSVCFIEEEPQKIEYKFVILEENGNPYGQIKIIEQQGFTLVGSFKEYVYILYRCKI